MLARLTMFGQNIYLLISLLIIATIVIIVIIAAWTGIKITLWKAEQKRADDQERRRKFRPDRQPLPPASRGICTACRRACEKVYHLATGERLCPTCYERHELEAAARDGPA